MDGLSFSRLTIIRPKRQQKAPMDGILTTRFRVGRYTVRMVADLDATTTGAHGVARVDWEPCMPAPGTLTAGDLRHYRKCRNALHQRIANIKGITIAVADV